MCGPRLRPHLEQAGTGLQRQPGFGVRGRLPGGVLGQCPVGGSLEGGRRSGAVARVAVVAGDLGGVGVGGLQRRCQQSVQPAALARRQRRRHGLPDEVVRGRPALLAEPEQAGRGQPGQRVERLAGVEAGGRRHDPGGGLPRQEGDERQDLRAHAGLPLGTPAHGPSLSLPTHLDRQRDGGGVAGLPPAVRPGGRGAAHRELAQHLGQRERSAVGLRTQHRGEPRVADERGERGVGEGAHRDVDDGAGGADGGQRGGRGGIGDTAHARGAESRLVGPEGEDSGQAGQPGQRGGEEGEAAGVGPLQVVDHEHGAVADGGGEELDAAREH